ncbi:hypothetical protein [Demequina sp. NBRC 110052]|uniref:hypothetical protein n=1 Tax=Demequina sp. NBRC 110052 TaxID=1570341 RepID=UPI00117C88A3|nr:hypothetical protein [Demequina sp. NBRC 110052]
MEGTEAPEDTSAFRSRWSIVLHSRIVWFVAVLAALSLAGIGVWWWSITQPEPDAFRVDVSVAVVEQAT